MDARRDGSARVDEPLVPLLDGSGGFALTVGMADATLDLGAGVVRVSTIDPAAFVSPSGAFPEGVLHSVDIPLYWGDLRHNAAVRWEAWQATHAHEWHGTVMRAGRTCGRGDGQSATLGVDPPE